MLLSFVVPAFNEEKYLGDCIASILKQTAAMGTMCEIIVVNNASEDGTRAVALAYPGVRVVDEPRKGLTFARQAGFKASRGKFVANVDADCRLPEGWVAKAMAEFEKSPGLVAVSGPLVYYDLTQRQRRSVKIFYGTAWLTYAINRWVLRVGSMLQGGNFVVTRSALEAIGGFNTEISFYGEDTDVARRLHKVGIVRFTFELQMNSSGRRLKHEGMLTTAARYSINYLWTTFLKRPFTEQHLDVREQTIS